MNTECDSGCIVTKDSSDDGCDNDGKSEGHESSILDDGPDLNEYCSYQETVGMLNVRRNKKMKIN
eukprot:89753-Ditylum_brightwellii.AAC.1